SARRRVRDEIPLRGEIRFEARVTLKMVFGKVGPERRVGAEMAERFGLERTHLANRAGLFGATAFFGDEPRERVADVAGRVRVVLQRAQRVLQKLGQRGLAVRAGDRDDAAAPAERREVE